MTREIYYDNSATTRTREEAAKLVYEMLTDCYGNPSSLHRKGFAAQQRLEQARAQMAQALGCQSGEIYFTAGGTEADNLAILGAARAQQRAGRRIVTTAIEHDAVLNTVAFLESEGWEIGPPEAGPRGQNLRPAGAGRGGRQDGAGLDDGGQQRGGQHPAGGAGLPPAAQSLSPPAYPL